MKLKKRACGNRGMEKVLARMIASSNRCRSLLARRRRGPLVVSISGARGMVGSTVGLAAGFAGFSSSEGAASSVVGSSFSSDSAGGFSSASFFGSSAF